MFYNGFKLTTEIYLNYMIFLRLLLSVVDYKSLLFQYFSVGVGDRSGRRCISGFICIPELTMKKGEFLI